MREQNFVGELMNLKVSDDDSGDGTSMDQIKKRDELYDSAIEVVIREGRGSCSLLQRCLGIGYGRAAKLIDFMAEDGIVGQYNGSKAREVLLTMEKWHEMQGLDPPEPDEEGDEEADDQEPPFDVPSDQPSAKRAAEESDDEYEYEYVEEEEYEEEDADEEYEDWEE